MKPNDNDAKIITSITDFMAKHKTSEILYARAIDSSTAVLLRIWLKHETIDMSQVPSHIIDANAASDEKTLVMDILKYLGERDTTGMTYSTKLSSGAKIKICVELTQMETPIESESEE